MGAADISLGELTSRAVRAIFDDRTINPIEREVIDGPRPSWLERAISIIRYDPLAGLHKFLLCDVPKAIAWSGTAILGYFRDTANFLWTFDWKASNEQLEKLIRAREKAINIQAAGVFGCALGHIICGSAGAALSTVIKVPKVALMRMIQAGGEEALDEFATGISSLAKNWFLIGTMNNLARLFMAGRSIANLFTRLLDSPFVARTALDRAIIDFTKKNGKAIQDSIFGPNAETFRFSEAWEERALPGLSKLIGQDPDVVEEFSEEFFECCWEILFVMAGAWDDYQAERQGMAEAVLGPERTVEIYPDRENPNERIYISGPESLVRTVTNNALITHQLINNRDVGQIVGRDLPMALASQPQTKTLYLNLFWRPQQKPPYAPVQIGGKLKNINPSIQIPFINPSQLTWRKIKNAMGGVSGIKIGPWRAYGWLNGYKVEFWGPSEAEAISNLKKIADLCDGELLSIGVSKKSPAKGRKNNIQYYQTPMVVYPSYGFIVGRQKVLTEEGQPTIKGNVTREQERFELWLDNAEESVTQLFNYMKKFYTKPCLT